MEFRKLIDALKTLAEAAPGIVGATKAQSQAAFRFKKTVLNLAEKAVTERRHCAKTLEDVAAEAGILFDEVEGVAKAVAVDSNDGIETRKTVIAALRAYNEATYLRVQASRRVAITNELASRGLNIAEFLN